jgi:hypothetical protein
LSLLVSLLLDELVRGELMTLFSVSLSYVSEDLQRLKVLLAMAPTLLLASSLVCQILTDLDPLLTVLVEELDEFDSLVQRPEVRLVSRWARPTVAPVSSWRLALSFLSEHIFFLSESSLVLDDERAE